jgi:hypothetical protein
MPKGGKRAGAGRPRGSLQKRHKVIVEDPTELMPVEWMLAVLRDPEAEQSRRDRMAEVAAPYLHPRLNAVGITSTNGPEQLKSPQETLLEKDLVHMLEERGLPTSIFGVDVPVLEPEVERDGDGKDYDEE